MIDLLIVFPTLRESCSHNGDLVDGWWNLEFPEPTPINKIVIYNRDDCCQDRIDGVKVIRFGSINVLHIFVKSYIINRQNNRCTKRRENKKYYLLAYAQCS